MSSIKHRLAVNYYGFIRRLRRKKLRNHGFSIIANNCCGGIMYHDLGERFMSPTINLAIEPEDFLTLVENLNECMEKDVLEVDGGDTFPVGRIVLDNGTTVTINFMHYRTFKEATLDWEKRKRRINWDNLFIFFEAGILTTDALIERFERLPYRKIAITNKRYPFKDTEFIDIYQSYHWGKLTEFVPGTLHSKRYLDCFDYIQWLNKER